MKFYKYINILFVLLFACNIDEDVAPLPQLPVVEAYVYAGLPVDDIRVSIPYTYTDSTSTSQYLTDLDIYLIQNEVEYLLNKPTEGNLKYSNAEIEIKEGDELSLYFEYNGKLVSANAVVPKAIENPSISTTYIEGPIIYSTDETTYWNSLDTLALNWGNEEEFTFSYSIQNLATDTTALTPLVAPTSSYEQDAFPTVLTDGTSITIEPEDFPYFSTYQINILGVTDDYADFIRSRMENEMNLTPAQSNVENGQGIFAAFSIWSEELEVVQIDEF